MVKVGRGVRKKSEEGWEMGKGQEEWCRDGGREE